MIINQLKGIRMGFKDVSIRIIKDSLDNVYSQLLDYKYNNEVDNIKEYQIYKLSLIMQNTDIFDLSYKELEEYINKLIHIVEFIGLQ